MKVKREERTVRAGDVINFRLDDEAVDDLAAIMRHLNYGQSKANRFSASASIRYALSVARTHVNGLAETIKRLGDDAAN